MNEHNTDQVALKLISVLFRKGLVDQNIVDQAHARYGRKVKDGDLKSAS